MPLFHPEQDRGNAQDSWDSMRDGGHRIQGCQTVWCQLLAYVPGCNQCGVSHQAESSPAQLEGFRSLPANNSDQNTPKPEKQD